MSKTKPMKMTPEEREIQRLRQSLMTIGTWARCFDVRYESPCKAMADIIKEVDKSMAPRRTE